MIDFIHLLPIPTYITDFNGDIIDANNEAFKSNKAGSLLNLQNGTSKDHFVDPNRLEKLVEDVFSGKGIVTQLIPMLDFEKNITFRTISLKILSPTDKLFIVQSTPNVHIDNLISNKFAELLSNIKRLKPYLNREGKLILEDLYISNMNILNNENLYVYLELLSKQLLQFFPILTYKEILVSAYITLGFSTKEITSISGITPNSLRVHIYNICQKLKLSSRDELIQLLKSHNSII